MKTAQDGRSRDRILATTASLLQDQGYHATGLNQIIQESEAPKGSLYYYFPGGKEELVAAAVRMSTAATIASLDACLDAGVHPVDGFNKFVEGSMRLMLESDYKKGCPIATVALETAPVSPAIQAVCAEFFSNVVERLKQRLLVDGYPLDRASALANLIFCGFEGAMIAARTHRDVAPLRAYQSSIASLLAADTFRTLPLS